MEIIVAHLFQFLSVTLEHLFSSCKPMNWQQLYLAATPQEREEILLLLLERLVIGRHRPVLVGGRLVANRRRLPYGWHFIHDRRMPPLRRRKLHLLRGTWFFILAVLSLSIWLLAFNSEPELAAPLILGYLLFILSILLIKPRRRLIAKG